MSTISTWAQLLRALVPSWRFFNETMVVPILEGRELTSTTSPQEWRSLIPKRGQRSFYEVFYNPRDTLLFAAHAALEQFVVDPSSQTSQKIIESLARDALAVTAFEYRVILDGEEVFRARSPEKPT